MSEQITTQPTVEALAGALMQVYDHGWQPNALREARALVALLPGRPESVVKAEALREAKSELEAAGSFLSAKWATDKLGQIADRIEAGL